MNSQRFGKIIGLVILLALVIFAGIYFVSKRERPSQEEIERQAILEELAKQAALQPELSAEDKADILEQLSEASQNEPALSDEEKEAILNSLSQ
ncbi:MAG TPA: hypothetical protein VJ103_02685 [Candidatus Paceibacterota bacterium]|nr:hypothetical protein [Candidatus Paceibacterota bacterium]